MLWLRNLLPHWGVFPFRSGFPPLGTTPSVSTTVAVEAHGPCVAPVQAPTVQSVQDTYWLPQSVQTALRVRQAFGEDKYGAPLCLGWTEADKALYQELLDGCQYAISGRRPVLAYILGWAAYYIQGKLRV